MMDKFNRLLGRFIEGLGIPTTFPQIERHIHLCKDYTHNNIKTIIIKDCTGGELIYTLTKDGWWVRYETNTQESQS